MFQRKYEHSIVNDRPHQFHQKQLHETRTNILGLIQDTYERQWRTFERLRRSLTFDLQTL